LKEETLDHHLKKSLGKKPFAEQKKQISHSSIGWDLNLKNHILLSPSLRFRRADILKCDEGRWWRRVGERKISRQIEGNDEKLSV
jgi:hypothetical protein